MSAACVQCEANARSNEAGGYAAAAECRAYCARGHKTQAESDLLQRSKDYARQVLINTGRATMDWTDDKLSEALALAYRAGYGTGATVASHAAEAACNAVARAVRS